MMLKKEIWKKLAVVSVFAIAMAFLEAVFVIYLRKLYYPGGFNFPAAFPPNAFIYNLEVIREFATIVMLASIGMLAGKKAYEKLAYFLYTFAIWDIFYYVFLKLTLDWPASLFTWDSLFLIPIQWVGPVLAPIIVSFTMILFAFLIIKIQGSKKKIFINNKEKALLISGCLIILFTFLYDYSNLIIEGGFLSNLFGLFTDQRFQQVVLSYVPTNYNWPVFIVGEILILSGIYLIYKNK